MARRRAARRSSASIASLRSTVTSAPELLEEVGEVVGEAVVVVDEEDHGAAAPILLGVGERRLEGGELAQALLVLGGRVGVGDDARRPAWSRATPSARTTVRMAMHVSSDPSGSA